MTNDLLKNSLGPNIRQNEDTKKSSQSRYKFGILIFCGKFIGILYLSQKQLVNNF